MAEVSIREFAESIKTPIERLLVQLGEAGLPYTGADERINDADKEQLLAYPRRSHGKTDDGKRLTLKRKQVSQLKVTQTGAQSGRKKTVTVQVKKSRVVTPPTGARGRAEAKTAAPAAAAQPVSAKEKRGAQDELKRLQDEG